MRVFDSIQFQFPSILRWFLMLAILIVPQAVLAESWQATVGAQSHDLGRQALAFLPNEISIHAGDSITWKVDTDEIHTVTFLIAGQTRLPFQAGCPGISPDMDPASMAPPASPLLPWSRDNLLPSLSQRPATSSWFAWSIKT